MASRRAARAVRADRAGDQRGAAKAEQVAQREQAVGERLSHAVAVDVRTRWAKDCARCLWAVRPGDTLCQATTKLPAASTATAGEASGSSVV